MAAETFEREYRTQLCELSMGEGRCRVESEIILPDYKEEAQRIIRVDTKARINRKNIYKQGQSLVCEVEGIATFGLLYMTDRRGEKACPSSFIAQENFSCILKTPLQEEIDLDLIFATVELNVENTSYKLLGPRKISMRSDLNLHMGIKYGKEFSFCSHLSHLKLEEKGEEIQFVGPVVAYQEDFSFSEMIALPSAYLPIEEVCNLDVALFADEVKAEAGGISFRGNAALHCNYVSQGDMSLISFYQPIEFEKHLAVPDTEPGDFVQVTLTPNFLKGTVDVNEDGENKNLLFEIGYSADVHVSRNETVFVLNDVFSLKNELNFETKVLEYEEISGSMDFSLMQKEECSIEENYVRAEGIHSSVEYRNSYLEEGKIVLEGRLNFGFLGIKENGEIFSVENFIPFRSQILPEEHFKINEKEERRIEIFGGVKALDIEPEEKKLRLRFELYGNIVMYSSHKTKAVLEIEMGQEKEKTAGEVIYLYPDKEDTLWGLCKEYNVSPDQMCRENKIHPTDVLPSVLRILR